MQVKNVFMFFWFCTSFKNTCVSLLKNKGFLRILSNWKILNTSLFWHVLYDMQFPDVYGKSDKLI